MRTAPSADTVTASMLPMEIRIGDRFTDHEFEWEVVTHPAALHGGKSLRASAQTTYHRCYCSLPTHQIDSNDNMTS
jgi:hypothetical protein